MPDKSESTGLATYTDLLSPSASHAPPLPADCQMAYLAAGTSDTLLKGKPHSLVMPRIVHLLLVLTAVALSGCGFVPEKVPLTDPRLAPMLRAIAAVDRASLGFTPIATNADVRLESRPRAGYDAMLHISSSTSRTIAFRKDGDGYRWIGEQEIHVGPKTYTTPDGPYHEEIVISYELERIELGATGVPLHQVFVSYNGEDARHTQRYNLTLDDVRPILAEWKQKL